MSYRIQVFLCTCFCVQTVIGQFGFFQNDQTGAYGFSQNFPSPRRIQQKLSSLLHLQAETPNSDPAFILPFNNKRPVVTDPYKNSDSNYYPLNDLQFPNEGQYQNYNRPQIPNFNQFESGHLYPNEPKHTSGLTFEDFIRGNKPSFGDRISTEHKSGGEETGNTRNPITDQNINEKYEPSTKRPGFDITTNVPNIFEEVFKPGYSNHSEGLIAGTVSDAPVFENKLITGFVAPDPTVDPSGPLIFGTSSEPGLTLTTISFGDRRGEEEKTTFPTLTPIPPSASRQNMNFGPAGLFKDTCKTVDGGDGTCVRIQGCEQYYQLLRNPRDKAVIDILRKSQCGFEGQDPKVCCPLPGFPEEPPSPQSETTPNPQGKSVTESDSTGLTPVPSLPEPPVCGVSEASFSRVVNGIPAKLGDFPWMALLGYHGTRDSSTRWLCGGSLVSPHHVLTAAHCIYNREDSLYVVRLGELDLADTNDGASPVDVLIKSKIMHEGYDSMAFTNDIGLLVLERDVEFTKLIKPICIPQDAKLRSQTFEKYNPLIAGWGDVAYRGPSASHLQVAQLPVVSNANCKETYSPYKKQVIDERVLCAGWKDGRQDACQGDSGGPLMQPIWNSQTYKTFFFQIGVVSFGKKCAEPGFPGVYTRVTHFVPWLEEKILST
ncbi:unnamed protein product [Leptosia nina]|uniref:CLIP domain-containing serine protease n=1 Tax=Leptosia nina TaxID=320188 RepID=A0AAV1JBL3_9NEOP